LIGGAACIPIVLGLLYAYIHYFPAVTEADLSRVRLEKIRFRITPDDLTIASGDERYNALPRFWRPGTTDGDLAHALKSSHGITLWLREGDPRIYGLEAGSLTIAPSAGIAAYMSNRRALSWLIYGFSGGGATAVGWGLWLRHRAQRPGWDRRA